MLQNFLFPLSQPHPISHHKSLCIPKPAPNATTKVCSTLPALLKNALSYFSPCNCLPYMVGMIYRRIFATPLHVHMRGREAHKNIPITGQFQQPGYVSILTEQFLYSITIASKQILVQAQLQ